MTVARDYNKQMIHYLRKTLSYSDDGTEVNIGTIPAGSVILKPISGVQVSTAFNASAGNVIQIGFSAGIDDPNLLGTSLALGTATFVPVDEAIGGYLVTVDATVSATVELTGTAATAGSCEVIICYIPDNDG